MGFGYKTQVLNWLSTSSLSSSLPSSLSSSSSFSPSAFHREGSHTSVPVSKLVSFLSPSCKSMCPVACAFSPPAHFRSVIVISRADHGNKQGRPGISRAGHIYASSSQRPVKLIFRSVPFQSLHGRVLKGAFVSCVNQGVIQGLMLLHLPSRAMQPSAMWMLNGYPCANVEKGIMQAGKRLCSLYCRRSLRGSTLVQTMGSQNKSEHCSLTKTMVCGIMKA